jgi:O-antigen/teichoic acid export membrane protein
MISRISAMVSRSAPSQIIRLAATILWSIIGEALSKGAFLIAMIAVARLLDQGSWGQFGLLRTTIATFSTFGGMGLGLTANRFIAEHRERDPGYSGELIGSTYLLAGAFGAIVGTVLLLCAPLIATRILDHPEMTQTIYLAAALVFLASINGAQTGILQGLESYRAIAVCNAVQGGVAVIAFVAGAYFFKLNGALGAYVIYLVAGLLVYSFAVRGQLRRYAIVVVYNRLNRIFPVFWSFSVPVALMGSAVAPMKWLAESWLARGSGFSELGKFYAGMVVVNTLIALTTTLHSPLVSATARLSHSEQSERMSYINYYASWYFFLIMSLPLILIPNLLSFLFGKSYSGREFNLLIIYLFIYTALMIYYHGITRLLVQRGTMWLNLGTNIVEGLTLVGAFYFVREQGALGLAIASIASLAMRLLVSVPVLVKSGTLRTKILTDIPFWISAAVMGGVIGLKMAVTH